jgi:integrase
MATVYRKTVTRPLPEGAELLTRKGQRLARWRDRKGERRTGAVIEGRDGTLRVSARSATYVAKYRDGSGVVREVSTGCRSKDAAQAVLRELMSRAENVRAGVVTASDDAVRDWLSTPVAESLTDYIDSLKDRGRSATHVADCERLAKRVFDENGIKLLRDIAGGTVEKWLRERSAENMAPRTRNSYLQAVRGFCRWCVSKKRLAVDPTRDIAKLDESSDIRRKRRSMTGDELQRLLYVATWRPLAERGRLTVAKPEADRKRKRDTWTLAPLKFADMPAALDRARERMAGKPEAIAKLEERGRRRALVYKALVLTGLRRGELASLTVADAVLDADLPLLLLDAADAKNGEAAEIPLRADLADDLRLWLTEKRAAYCESIGETVGVLSMATGEPVTLPPGTPLLDVPSELIKVFDADLALAGIAKKDDRGRTLDVHALRHSFGSLLSAGGVAPRTAQAAMRHSTIDLTMNVYTDPRVLDVAGALDSLPSLPLDGVPQDRQRARATGTDSRWEVDRTAPSFVAPTVAPNLGKPSKLEASADNPAEKPLRGRHEKTSAKQAVSRGLLRVANGSRTHDLRNHNPTL